MMRFLWPRCGIRQAIMFLPCGFFVSSFSSLWPPYVIGQAIIFLSCGFFYLLLSIFFFPRLISAVADWMSNILPKMCASSANLECRSEMCCTWLAGNAGSKKSPKIGYLGTITQLCWAISLQLRHI